MRREETKGIGGERKGQKKRGDTREYRMRRVVMVFAAVKEMLW